MSVPIYTGQIPVPTGGVTFVRAMSTKCLHCNQYVIGDHEFYALADPYAGVLHPKCLAHFAYPPSWPHPAPAIMYRVP
jgi:hypothetical protein